MGPQTALGSLTARRLDSCGARRRGSGWGLSALGAGLYRLAKDSIIEYETQIKAGKFIVIGSFNELSKTQEAFAASKHQGMKEHSCCA